MEDDNVIGKISSLLYSGKSKGGRGATPSPSNLGKKRGNDRRKKSWHSK